MENILPVSIRYAVAEYFGRELVVEGSLDRGDEIISDWEERASIDDCFAAFKSVAGIGFAGSRGRRQREIAFELLEFSIEENVALAVNESPHLVGSPSVVSAEVDVVHAHECIVKAHERRNEIVERVTNVILVVVWEDESVGIAGTSKIGAGVGKSDGKIVHFVEKVSKSIGLLHTGDVRIGVCGQNCIVKTAVGSLDRDPSSGRASVFQRLGSSSCRNDRPENLNKNPKNIRAIGMMVS